MSGDSASPAEAILFYDGTCGFCARAVQFILKHERAKKSLHFAPLQGAAASGLLSKHTELANVDSMVWFEPATSASNQRVLIRSDAGLAAMAYLGGLWRVLATLGWCVPRAIRDWVYNLVAKNRRRLAGGASCLLPSAEQRARFID